MSWQPSGAPLFAPVNLADYATFLQNVVGVPRQYLALISSIVLDSSGAYVTDSNASQVTSNPLVNQFQLSLGIAYDLVNDTLCCSQDLYVLAVYNLAADRLMNFGMDINGQTFFKDARTLFKLFSPTMGVVSSASDQGTGDSILNPDFMKNLTILDLQTLKTPFGRNYMGIAQSVGTLWGVS